MSQVHGFVRGEGPVRPAHLEGQGGVTGPRVHQKADRFGRPVSSSDQPLSKGTTNKENVFFFLI